MAGGRSRIGWYQEALLNPAGPTVHCSQIELDLRLQSLHLSLKVNDGQSSKSKSISRRDIHPFRLRRISMSDPFELLRPSSIQACQLS